MSEHMTPKTDTEVPSVPPVGVQIYLPKDPGKEHGKLLAFASANLGGVFAINNIRVYDSEKGPFVSMPSSKGKDGKYHDICCPTTKEMRQALNEAVLGEYQRAVERPSVRDNLQNAAKAAAARPVPDVERTANKGAR